MMAIVLEGLEQKRFSLIGFYLGRARRIAPGLLLLIAALLALGWFWLPTPDYQALGSQSAYSLGFLSNILFWRSSGYFDAAAHEKWLLHTWSLGVEAQFYLLFPLYMMLLWKIRPNLATVIWGTVFLFIASLALSILISSWKPTFAFYLLPTRGWELAAGGLAYLAGREVQALSRFGSALQTVGWALLVVAAATIDELFPWPSGWALLPTAGTICILLANQHGSVLTGNRLAQWLGNRSYSLYLWHWPLMVALYFAGLQEKWLWVTIAIALSFALADLSYRLIESPIRHRLAQIGHGKQVTIFLVAIIMIGSAAIGARFVNFSNRLPPAVEAMAAEVRNSAPRDKCFETASSQGSPGCVYGGREVGVILAGDSHAMSVVTAFGEAAKSHGRGVLFWGHTGCPTISELNSKGSPGCKGFNEWIFNELSKYPAVPIVLVNRTSVYIMGHNELGMKDEPLIFFPSEGGEIDKLKLFAKFQESIVSTACGLAVDRPVYLVRPIPEMAHNIPTILSRNLLLGRNKVDFKIPLNTYRERHKLVWEAQDEAAKRCGVRILNPLPYLCDKEYCYGSRDGRPLYHDDDHLSEYGNRFLIPMFEEIFSSRGDPGTKR